MPVKLHDLLLALETDAPCIGDEWARCLAPFPWVSGGAEELLHLKLTIASAPLLPPAGPPLYSQHDLSVYPAAGGAIVIHLPGRALLRVAPDTGRVEGALTPEALDRYGAFEDLLAIGLAPLMRRSGKALIHAFGAAWEDEALLLVGDRASGKTTTGLALLAAGWKFLANDCVLIAEWAGEVNALAYPGLLSASAEALRRIPSLRPRVDAGELAPRKPGWKIAVPAEELFPSPWGMSAPVRAICLLKLGGKGDAAGHNLEPLSPAVAFGRLLPHSVDRWDRDTLVFQIDLLERLSRQAPAYLLRLGPDVASLPALLGDLLADLRK